MSKTKSEMLFIKLYGKCQAIYPGETLDRNVQYQSVKRCYHCDILSVWCSFRTKMVFILLLDLFGFFFQRDNG